MLLAQNLKMLIKRERLTIAELAKNTEVPKSTIHNWMNGVKPRDIGKLKIVADYFGMEISKLLFTSLAVDKFVYLCYNESMEEKRRTHYLKNIITVNEISIDTVIIDSHVDKHSEHITDQLILSLVQLLDGKTFTAVKVQEGFSYYVSRVLFAENVYRLVWLQKEGQFYIGIVTSFKEKGAKHDIS